MLNKQAVTINFAQGLDQKTDPKQVAVGKMLRLENSVFTKSGLLAKRNGYGALTALPSNDNEVLTTFNGNLTAVGSSLNAYSQPTKTWINKGRLQPAELSVLPLIRSGINQSQADAAISPNGQVCTVYTNDVPSGGSTTPQYAFAVADATTGQNIIPPTVLPGAATGGPRVFALGNSFIIVYTTTISANDHLVYVAVNTTTNTVSSSIDITSGYSKNSATMAWDGAVINDTLYLAWNGSDSGGAIRMVFLSASMVLSAEQVFAGRTGKTFAVTGDTMGSTPTVYVAFGDASNNAYLLSTNQNLVPTLSPTQFLSAVIITNLTLHAANGSVTAMYEVANTYSYSATRTDYIQSLVIAADGSFGSSVTVARSVGLASKCFVINGVIYVLAAYGGSLQPSYFVIDVNGNVIVKLAYSNGAGYTASKNLPQANIDANQVHIAYLIKDQVRSVNKTQGATDSSPIYAQTGVNLANITIGTSNVSTQEIGQNLNLSGGFLWSYDGYTPVEQGFHVWPDDVGATPSTTGGFMAAQDYFYVATYEWTDNQGLINRSAPSIPLAVTTTGTTSSVTVNVPTLRLTYKVKNKVSLVIYRWSTANQNYFQVTKVAAPVLNDPTADSIAIVDTSNDSDIVGNTILYTTGGVIENIAMPATSLLTTYKSRLVGVNAEDPNQIWFSKQVVENVPVEMSDLLTRYIAPTAGAQGSTGPITALCPMDDKLILFKKNAIVYQTGNGPDNTGANDDTSEAVFITSTVGCSNQSSIVFTPGGLMFQSDKGIWLLGRDLSSSYIGAPVEDFTTSGTVESAVNVPGTNQVRFTLSSGITLMYDYYYAQWGSFTNVPAVSATLYQGLHTYINAHGAVYQETIGKYLDGSSPVNLSFTTSWINMGGLQGFQRAYYFYLLGSFLSPHKLTIQIGYDYSPGPSQTVIVNPDNYGPDWGGDALWGSNGPWGGPSNLEQWQVYLRQQKCESVQITITESYDPAYGAPAGAGLTLSGIDLSVGIKDSKPRIRASRNIG